MRDMDMAAGGGGADVRNGRCRPDAIIRAMTIALGADHAGVALKDAVKHLLDARGLRYTDFGTTADASVDYPDYAAMVARAVASGEADRGILVCGTGVGMAIAANKIAGIRAAPVYTAATAQIVREHNDLNVLTLGARTTTADEARDIVAAFLDTPFAGGRHGRRVDKISALDTTR